MSRPAVAIWLMVAIAALSSATCPATFGQESAQPTFRDTSVWHTVTILKDGKWVDLRGTVENVHGSTLQFESSEGVQLQSLSFESIKDFTFTADVDFQRAVADFKTGNYRAARQQFETALDKETRDWAKAELLAHQALAMIADGQRKESLPLFQQIHQLDPSSRLLGQLPLVWDANLPDDERLKLPANQLTTGDDVLRLAIASSVLEDGEHQDRAIRVLKQLRTDSRSAVLARLAAAQLWRLSLLTTDDSVPMLVDVWHEQWKRMSVSCRPGPGLVLGRCLQHQHLDEQAALVLLWSPLVQVNDPAVAAASLESSLISLNAVGRKFEAEVVFQELMTRFPRSSAARLLSRDQPGK